MKRATSAVLLLCLLIPVLALADTLDFSYVVEKDGRLTGKIITAEPTETNADTTLRVDCAVPQPFTEEQWVRLRIEFWQIEKKAFEGALNRAGTSTAKGSWWNQMNDPMRREIAWRGTPDIDTANLVAATELTAQMQAAVETYHRFFKSLGLQPDIVATCDYARRDYAACRQSSEAEARMEQNYDNFIANEARQNRDPADYTFLVGRMSLRGLPVGTMSYPDGDAREPSARINVGSWASALADKEGRLVNVYVSALPIEASAEPLPAGQPDWRQAFQKLNEQLYAQTDAPYWSVGAKDVLAANDSTMTDYTTYMTLTAIEPVWVGRYPNELVPGYRFTIETRRRRDDALVWRTEYDVDGVELAYCQ